MTNIETVHINYSSLVLYGDESEEAYDFEGSVSIECSNCGFKGFVDIDHNGYDYSGLCQDCDLDFTFQ